MLTGAVVARGDSTTQSAYTTISIIKASTRRRIYYSRLQGRPRSNNSLYVGKTSAAGLIITPAYYISALQLYLRVASRTYLSRGRRLPTRNSRLTSSKIVQRVQLYTITGTYIMSLYRTAVLTVALSAGKTYLSKAPTRSCLFLPYGGRRLYNTGRQGYYQTLI